MSRTSLANWSCSGTRSVSTLTPAQLARKRANDREAQRAIRARTKEHIERLERELAELKGVQSRDRKVQELLRRNKILEEEIARLREHLGYTATESSYSSNAAGTPSTIINNARDLLFGQLTPSPSVYDGDLSSSSGAVPSPRVSPLPSSDFHQIPDYAQQSYGHITSAASEPWPASVPPNPVLGNIPSPSSPAHGDEYNVGYIPTSVPTSMMSSSLKEIKQDYDEIDHNSQYTFIPTLLIMTATNISSLSQVDSDSAHQPCITYHSLICSSNTSTSTRILSHIRNTHLNTSRNHSKRRRRHHNLHCTRTLIKARHQLTLRTARRLTHHCSSEVSGTTRTLCIRRQIEPRAENHAIATGFQ